MSPCRGMFKTSALCGGAEPVPKWRLHISNRIANVDQSSYLESVLVLLKCGASSQSLQKEADREWLLGPMEGCPPLSG